MLIPRVLVAAAAVASALAVLSSPAAAQTAAPPCSVGPVLVDVAYSFLNEQDLTSDGRVWALDSGFSTFRLYRTGPSSFCAVTAVSGTFTTFTGPSPAGTGTVPAGHSGRFAGRSILRFGGTFAPTLPTSGFVGTFDAGCNQFDCATPIQFGRKYLEVTGPPTVESFQAVYVSSCGVWIQTSQGDRGDIAC
jgi:hypothetical protein